MSRKYSLPGLPLLLAAVTLIVGCSGGPSSNEKIRRALSVNTSTSVDQYVLGATDVVKVSVWRNEDLSVSVPVRPDGKISVPLVGDVQASDRTPTDLANEIEERLGEYIRQPEVSVVVTSMGSHEFNDRVRVTGAVQQPVSVPHRAGMTVLDVVLNAGGATPFASLNKAMLYRKVDGEVIAIPIRLEDILNDGDVRTNYSIRPGDILSVPERSF
ncbi:XrtA/PEP-CTERM system exopolysaccharide export protein [Marinobacter sp.]|uniref:XrtA/PEP-CTERM system exopolysaccharide export protein n=1 Tax=Marinobacter sp. TaxID=50741 RepID=UPI0034A4AB93